MTEQVNLVARITPGWLAERCEEVGDCLVWKLACNESKQPTYSFKVKGKGYGRQLRRLVYEAARGPVDWDSQNKVVTMACGDPRCLNHKHMKVTTKGAVIRKMMSNPDVRRRVMVAGALYRRPMAKITMEQARYIRESGKTLVVLSKELGVSVAWVSKVRRGEAWRELKASPFAGLFTGLAANDSSKRKAA